MWCNTWLKQGCSAILLGIKGVVLYFWLKQRVWCNTFRLKQGCGAILLDLNKGVVQYFWLKQGCGAILLA